jgi:hypothetical protein
MASNMITELRVSAFRSGEMFGADDTNQVCHGNKDGVDPNDKAILAHVRVMVVCWGRFYEDHPDAGDNAFALCRDLVTGPYLNGLAQYGVGLGSMAGQGTIDDTNPPATLSEDEARDRIKSFVRDILPEKPAVNETSLLYVIFPPPQTKPTISTGKDDFSGYHESTKFHDESQNNDLFYALIRTDKADQSSGKALIDAVSY